MIDKGYDSKSIPCWYKNKYLWTRSWDYRYRPVILLADMILNGDLIITEVYPKFSIAQKFKGRILRSLYLVFLNGGKQMVKSALDVNEKTLIH